MSGAKQFVAWSVVLEIAGNDRCDKPLKLYLILTCVRLGLSLPCEFLRAPSLSAKLTERSPPPQSPSTRLSFPLDRTGVIHQSASQSES